MNRRRLFGTSGIRGVVDQDLSPDFCHRAALAIGTTLPQSSTVCIATDTRTSRDVIKDAVTTGLLSCGVNVVDSGILPTPALALLTRELGFAAGIMITASHNPPEFNGIKLFTENSLGYGQAQESEIEKIFFGKQFRQGKRGSLEQGQDMKEKYFSFIKGKLSWTTFKQEPNAGGGDDGSMSREGKVSSTGFKQEPGAGGGDGGRLDEGELPLRGFKRETGVGVGCDEGDSSREGKLALPEGNRHLKIVVDPGNGAAAGFASDICVQMGFHVLPVNNEPDGLFPGRSPEPKEDTLQGTVDFLRQHNADLAICFDGDADRVVFCDKEGFLGFNEPIAFISRLAVKRTGKKTVATTVETGTLLDLAVKDLGAEVVRGRVGDVPVAHLAQELDAALGVEQVGVYIMPEVGYYPDSIFASLFLLSQLRDVGEIRQFFQGVPRLFFEKAKVSCPNELKEPVMARVKEQADTFSPEEINTLDGLRLQFADSWMLIRPSGTEPVIRVISESISQKQTGELVGKGKGLVQSLVDASG
jgi:phosphomannomutase